jgi:alpha-tubulin suppressor-like RCC1 family protein
MRTLRTRSLMLLAALTLVVAGAAPVAASSRTYSSIAAGGTHSCALTARGAAYCWGDNDYGQLGDGTTTESGENGPQAVIGGLKFASIAVGDGHTCAITTRGAAYCWGRNTGGEGESFGQLGDGTTTNSYNNGPQAVIGGLKFASITAGEYHTCAIATRGAAYCWGRNFDGQLGDGTTIDSGASGPQRVVGGHKFASITGGEDHTCALTTQGAAYCWGYNSHGRLGDGTTDDTDGNPPQQVIGGHRFASISASYLHTCAITTRGAAYCWGYNDDGQLGDGTTTASNEGGPQAVIGGLKFASIKAGEYHTCAITTRGAAYCWGYNVYGELGDGTTTDSRNNGPQAVIGGLKFASIDGGNEHTCALTTRGTAYCWGANWQGQLGDGTSDDSEENGPQAVQ